MILTADIFTSLRSFLMLIVPNIEVVQALDNGVPECEGPDFIVMTQTRRDRLSTDSSAYNDVAFTGSILGTTLTVTNIINGAIVAGQTIYGNGISAGTVITAGSGLAWTVTPSQTVISTTLQAGTVGKSQAMQVTIQLDIHGPNSADNAQIVATLFRSNYGVNNLQNVSPLYTSDPQMIPFINAEEQWEARWVVDLAMQVNPLVSIFQDFAGFVQVGLANVTTTYP